VACSKCARSTGKECVDIAKEKGYSGFVITDHFWGGNTSIDKGAGWAEFVKAYKDEYEVTKEYGSTQGIQVFFGIEDGIGRGKEILIYGIDPGDLMNHPEYLELPLKEKIHLLHSLGGVVFLAHPFRDRQYIAEPDLQPDPALFDGIEGYNRGNDESESQKAFVFAKENGLLIISGGDIHRIDSFGFSGIEFSEKPTDSADFVAKIKANDFSLIME